MENIKTHIGNQFQKHTGKFKIVVAVLIVLGLFVAFSTITLGSDKDFQAEHNQLDEQIRRDFNSWLSANAMRRFCLPKADLLVQEMEIRQKLGDDTSSLEARLKNVSDNCTEVTKQVLFS